MGCGTDGRTDEQTDGRTDQTFIARCCRCDRYTCCAVLPGCHWLLWCLARNNGKLLTQAPVLNSTRRLDHCDVKASLGFACRAKLTDTPNQTSFMATHWDQTQACYIWIESMDIKPSRSVYVPNSIPSVQLHLRREWQSSIDFQEQDGRNARISESRAAQFSLEISRICEFRVIMGIMTGLLGRCLWSTFGLRANDHVKTLTSLGLWLHHSPWALRCLTNNAHADPVIIP